ncbi:MAG: carotenoid oxygenase family protein [Myxococcota bacterium]
MEQALDVVRRSLATVTAEHQNLTLRPLSGAVPPTLSGTLYRNGPGRLERGGQAYGHLFDGDGHIMRFHFEGGTVTYSNRFVRTAGYVAEEEADALLYRGFGTNLPGGLRANALRMRFKNAANTNVIAHGDDLLALWEGGLPHRLDPATLETKGAFDFDGQLENRSSRLDAWLAPKLPFSAHPCFDDETGELFNFGMSVGRVPRLFTYRVGPDGVMDEPRAFVLDRMSFVHDFALTDRYLVFLLPPADFDVPRALLGLSTPAASLRLDTHRPMEALLVPRKGGLPIRMEAASGFVFHLGQGFDRDDGAVVLDAVRFEEYPPLDNVESLYEQPRPGIIPRPVRLVLDPASGRASCEPWTDRGAELPTVRPGGRGPRRFVYSVGAPADRAVPFFTAVQKLDTHNGRMIARDFGYDLPGEPLFAPRGDAEDDGWLVFTVFRAEAERTELVVLEAGDLSEVAVLPLPHSVPVGFHGTFRPR